METFLLLKKYILNNLEKTIENIILIKLYFLIYN